MDSTKVLVKKILESAQSYKWSLQGFGMLRLYLNDETRLHVWCSDFSVPKVSTIHDHPWDFNSRIVAGVLRNQRYAEEKGGPITHMFSTIQCGPGGCVKTEPQGTSLYPTAWNRYQEGDVYMQHSSEIHESRPEDGTVTLCTRFFHENRDLARVFWPAGEKWVSAEPREATPREVELITKFALNGWF